jgi:hypothetical protein
LQKISIGDGEANDISVSKMSRYLALELLFHFIFVDLEVDRISENLLSGSSL